MRHLEEITGRNAGLGPVTTSVVYSSALQHRPVVAGAGPATGPARRRP
ncbi:hypothetical protein SAMN05443637_101115 [Pseudonocardia thermophila]|jgi:hypothetical protein|uniref:Uncharacterized protein n=1 Tax=Pseudonocardia thermophila TaxID=1848 RepID=A0A1M6NA08_PSETH|nr:hypothetical protein [Pseudonocardia thermophila]SHJ92406.1 hypothetical protein SAMN05443637_101115 [Pseudonocardia thermophila]